VRATPLAVLLLLGACSGPGLNDRQKDEVSDIASAEAADVVSESSRISELESRVDDLESRVDEISSD